MKRVKYLLLVCMMGLLLTGCVKYNVNMDIKKDKSMEFSIIYAVDTSIFGDDNDSITEDQISELKEQGFSVTEYSEGNMKGYSLTKKIKNIDEVSSSGDVSYSLSGLLDSSNDVYMFKVKKGFLKNTYIAEFNFDSNDSGLSMDSNTVDSDDNSSLEGNGSLDNSLFEIGRAHV